jgi:putative ABC transport system permease protein
MKHLPLIWAGLWRKPTRTVFTMTCIVIAFLLFGLLQGVDSAFSRILGQQKLDRLFVDPRFPQPLPMSYREQIAAVRGVTRLTQVAFFGGSYQDPKNGVLVIATNPAVWLAIRPEFHVPKEQLAAVARVRTGVIISDWLAQKNGWKIGDKFTLHTLTPTLKGSTDWTFDVTGIMRNPDTTGEIRQLLANFDYYDEGRATGKGTANRFLLRIDDARHSARVAQQIDHLFVNSPVQTRTQSEQESAQSAIASIGDMNFFTRAIMAAVFFTLLVLTGNTMMESVRERTSELAVLQTIGFTEANVLLLVLAEALVLCVVAALIGLGLAASAFPLAKSFLGTALLPPVVVVLGTLFAIAVALLSAFIPAWRAMRLNIVDALAVR